MTIRLLAAISALFLALASPVSAEARVTVFAAASLKTALDRAVAEWRAAGGAEVVLVYAGTPALARQIEAGAPADIFISASSDWMDVLEEQGLIDAGSRRDLAGNRLVLVQHGEGPAPVEIGAGFDLAGLIGDGRLAMALVDAVPAGIYGREALRSLGLWDGIFQRVAETDNVRAALALVALGEAPFGIVYASDARAEPGVSVAGLFPAGSHPPIVYPAALVAGRSEPGAAAFLEHLGSRAVRALFEAEGFLPPGAG